MAKKKSSIGRPAARSKTRKNKAPAAKLSPLVDYPREGDLVRPGHYAVRLDAPAACEVQIRLDGTAWIACREAVGFFWHDWSPQKPGPVVLLIRARRAKGRWVVSPERRCVVEA